MDSTLASLLLCAPLFSVLPPCPTGRVAYLTAVICYGQSIKPPPSPSLARPLFLSPPPSLRAPCPSRPPSFYLSPCPSAVVLWRLIEGKCKAADMNNETWTQSSKVQQETAGVIGHSCTTAPSPDQLPNVPSSKTLRAPQIPRSPGGLVFTLTHTWTDYVVAPGAPWCRASRHTCSSSDRRGPHAATTGVSGRQVRQHAHGRYSRQARHHARRARQHGAPPDAPPDVARFKTLRGRASCARKRRGQSGGAPECRWRSPRLQSPRRLRRQ